jgi:hypothetical protein
VILAIVDVFQQSAGLQRLADIPCIPGQAALIVVQILELCPLDAAGGALETEIDHIAVQTDGLEQLRAAIAGDGRDSHFRHDLVQALVDALAVIVEGAGGVPLPNLSAAHHVAQAIVGQIRKDGGGAVPDQAREVMGIAGGSGFDHDVGVAP